MTTGDVAIGDTSAHTRAGLSILRRPAHVVVKLSGDLDIATTPALRERLTALLHPGMRLLVLDLSGVSFCDAAGLAVLIGTKRRAASLGIILRLAAPGAQVTKILRFTGLDRTFTIHPTLTVAISRPRKAGGIADR